MPLVTVILIFVRAVWNHRAYAVAMFASSLLGLSLFSAAAAAPRPPNFVVILADDLGYADIGCFGSRIHATPHLDRLAQQGLRFTDFHANGPVCSPTRAAFLTGRYQQRCGVENVYGDDPKAGLHLGVQTLAGRLRAAGYATGIFGKWHLGLRPPYMPTRFGFDEFRGHAYGDADYHSHIDRLGNPDWWFNEELVPQSGYATDLTADNAIDFIRRQRDRPFLCFVPFTAPHFPWQGPRDPPQREVGKNYWDDRVKFGPRTDRKEALREMIENLDTNIGRMIDCLRELRLETNTLVVFASDNGGYDFISDNGPFRGTKGQLFEGGHRVPGIAWWPGRIKPGQSHATVLTMDLAPTLLELAGVTLPSAGDQPFDGVSLVPHLTRGEPLPERTVFWRFRRATAARHGLWKLHVPSEGGPQLYHLGDDPRETRNLANSEPTRVVKLLAEITAWERDVDADHAAIKAKPGPN